MEHFAAVLGELPRAKRSSDLDKKETDEKAKKEKKDKEKEKERKEKKKERDKGEAKKNSRLVAKFSQVLSFSLELLLFPPHLSICLLPLDLSALSYTQERRFWIEFWKTFAGRSGGCSCAARSSPRSKWRSGRIFTTAPNSWLARR